MRQTRAVGKYVGHGIRQVLGQPELVGLQVERGVGTGFRGSPDAEYEGVEVPNDRLSFIAVGTSYSMRTKYVPAGRSNVCS